MVRSAIKKIRRKSQREAARLQRQADAVRAMEEEEEVQFKRPDTVPDTPRVSRSNSPDPEDGDDRGARDYTAVLEMVKTVRDRLTALASTIRTFGLPAMICAGSAIVKEWRLATCRAW